MLRFDVSPETLALFREAMAKLGRSGTPLDDDSALMSMARLVLGGPVDEGRASYQIALSVCPECGRGRQQARGELVSVGAEVVAMAECDGQHLGPLTAPVASTDSVSSNGSVANEGAHVGARAKQTIAPATRRAVVRRDHQRCVVPGCRNALFLDLHHIAPRSEGGAHDADNLITLCGVHHRAAHRGELVVEGSVPTGVRFRHTDGSDYGQAPEPRVAEIRIKAFAALRGLGFREGEIRRALAESRKLGDNRKVSIDRVVRDALIELTVPAPTRSHPPSSVIPDPRLAVERTRGGSRLRFARATRF